MKLFKHSLLGKDDTDYRELLTFAIERGYFVHKDCATKEVKQFLNTKPSKRDLSSTFYKRWEDVKDLDRLEIFYHQILYYFTGINVNDYKGQTIETPDIFFQNLKPILPISAEEACAKCEQMLASGIALSKDTILSIFEVFDKCSYNDKINIDKIKNREARILAFKILEKLPTEVTEFLRYLVYLATDEFMLIKNTEFLAKIQKSNLDVSEMVKTFGVAKLATIYGRYKLIFMAFKHANKANITVMNQLTKKSQSKACKEAKAKGVYEDANYFQTLLSGTSKDQKLDEDKLKKKLTQLNNFKKIALLETVNMYLLKERESRVFLIRNSKVWVKPDVAKPEPDQKPNPNTKRKTKNTPTFPLKFKKYKTSKRPFVVGDEARLRNIYRIVYESLIESLRMKYSQTKEGKFRLPEKCTLTAPKSDKAFVGEYPYGSWLALEDANAIVGISWDENDNANDFDLSLVNMNSQKIGWNSEFKSKDSTILFSGDVVEPPGTELIYASDGFDFDSCVYVNLYRGKENPSFKFFVARERIEKKNITKNYMIDPNNIVFSTKVNMESTEMAVGFITSGRFIFTSLRSGNSRVSSGNKSSATLIKNTLQSQKCHLELKKILLDMGFSEDSNASMQTDQSSSVFTFDTKSDIIEFFRI